MQEKITSNRIEAMVSICRQAFKRKENYSDLHKTRRTLKFLMWGRENEKKGTLVRLRKGLAKFGFEDKKDFFIVERYWSISVSLLLTEEEKKDFAKAREETRKQWWESFNSRGGWD